VVDDREPIVAFAKDLANVGGTHDELRVGRRRGRRSPSDFTTVDFDGERD
jgi:hypothetical protein